MYYHGGNGSASSSTNLGAPSRALILGGPGSSQEEQQSPAPTQSCPLVERLQMMTELSGDQHLSTSRRPLQGALLETESPILYAHSNLA